MGVTAGSSFLWEQSSGAFVPEVPASRKAFVVEIPAPEVVAAGDRATLCGEMMPRPKIWRSRAVISLLKMWV